MAAAERWGKGKANALREGAGNARPLHACARPALLARWSGLLSAHPAPTVRTLEEEPRGLSPPCRDLSSVARPSRCWVATCFFSGDLGTNAQEHIPLLRFSLPSPMKNGVGGPGRVRESPLRVFPPTLTL